MIIFFLDEAGAMRCEVARDGAAVAGALSWLVRLSILYVTRRYGNYGDQVDPFRDRSLFILRIPATTTFCDCSSFALYTLRLSLVVLPTLPEIPRISFCGLWLYHEWLSCCSLSLSFRTL